MNSKVWIALSPYYVTQRECRFPIRILQHRSRCVHRRSFQTPRSIAEVSASDASRQGRRLHLRPSRRPEEYRIRSDKLDHEAAIFRNSAVPRVSCQPELCHRETKQPRHQSRRHSSHRSQDHFPVCQTQIAPKKSHRVACRKPTLILCPDPETSRIRSQPFRHHLDLPRQERTDPIQA